METQRTMYHKYADDTQIYVVEDISFDAKKKRCESCMRDVKEWMDVNMLKLNEDKTEVMIVGSKRQTAKILDKTIDVNGCEISIIDKVKNLGITLDSSLSMDSQVSSLRNKLIFQLKKISHIRKYITNETCKKIISSLMFSNLDYCNSLLSGVSADQIRRLQVVQNNAARLVLGNKRSDRASPLLRELHWLPVRARIQYKLATFVYKCLQGSAPIYLQEFLKTKTSTTCSAVISRYIVSRCSQSKASCRETIL